VSAVTPAAPSVAPSSTESSATPPAETPEDPAAELLALHRAGRLAAEFPRVAALLAAMDDAQTVRAGQLLSRVDPDEVLAAHPAVPAVRVAVTGHGTLAPLLAPLTAQLARHGLALRPRMSPFDSYVFDFADPGSELYAFSPDLALCILDPAIVADELPLPWTVQDAQRVLQEKTDLIERLADRFAQTAKGTLVLNTLPFQRKLSGQLVDYRSRAELGASWREANARLLRLSARYPSVVVVDLDPILAEGVPAADPRLSAYTKAHLSGELLAGYAREVGHLARQVTGRVKKTLVVDLDNTLWGGILGDDGQDGIEVAGSYRGEAFRAFQRAVKQLGSQGVLLAAVSKNEAEPVRRVFAEHPEMTLRESDFVRVTANWRPKDANLRELAETLNLGVDSFVFADDSPYECGLVRHSLPGVAVVGLDTEPALHPVRLLRDGWFDTRELTAEDRARPAQYRDEAARADFQQSFSSLDDYLRELGVKVRLELAREADVSRVSQITLRTNQFNLTTRRLQPADVRAQMQDPQARVLVIRSADRFGDNGLVGAVFVRYGADAARIENFLLSCRVFSRGIEQACLAAILRDAARRGAPAVLGEYAPTAKNVVVKDFYPRHGFAEAGGTDGATVFRHDLAEPVEVPGHLELLDELEGPTHD
jgi:FkbH-like protein